MDARTEAILRQMAETIKAQQEVLKHMRFVILKLEDRVTELEKSSVKNNHIGIRMLS